MADKEADFSQKDNAYSMYIQLERELCLTIPNHLKQLLVTCGYHNLFALANFDSTDISCLEQVAREHAFDLQFTQMYYPYCIDRKNYAVLPSHRKLLIALGKHAAYKVKNFTIKNYHY